MTDNIEFITQRIEQQKQYLAALDLMVHKMPSHRYREVRESAAGVLRDFWERKKKLKQEN